MVFYIKGIGYELRQKYGRKLFYVEGAIGVLEEMVCDDITNNKEDNINVLNDNNFNSIYDAVLNRINKGEEEKGFSEYRAMLDRIDKKLDKLTARDRKDIRRIEERSAREMSPKISSQDYARPIYHVSMESIDSVGVT